MTFDAEDITFMVMVDIDASMADIYQMAQEQWDALFAQSSRSKRTTQPRLVGVSPASDDGRRSVYHFRGTLLD